MFPGVNASVYYNEAGEVLGWDDNYYDDPPDEPDWDEITDGEQAYEAGYEDGYHGEPCQVVAAHGPEDRHYLGGYDDGREDRNAADVDGGDGYDEA